MNAVQIRLGSGSGHRALCADTSLTRRQLGTPQSDELPWAGLLPELTKGFVPWLGDTASPKGHTWGACERTPCPSLFNPSWLAGSAGGGSVSGGVSLGVKCLSPFSLVLKPGFGSDTKATLLHVASASWCACARGGAGAVSFRHRGPPGDALRTSGENRSCQPASYTRRTASPPFGARSPWWVREGGHKAKGTRAPIAPREGGLASLLPSLLGH